MSTPPRVACILVNWNGWQDTIACLDALALQDYASLGIIVVDNGSTNDSTERIRQAHPAVTLHETCQNLGYAAGCNAGIRLAYQHGADFIWLLNNDTVAPPATASSLMRAALAHPHAGVIGAVLYYMHNPTQVQAWGGGCINLFTAYVSHFTQPASFATPDTFFTGASLLLPRHICESVGILYEGFFMYADDTDLCLRLHRAGHTLVMCEDTAILHREGASSTRRSPIIDQYSTTSGMRLLRRQAPHPFFSTMVYLTLRLGHRFLKGRWSGFAAVCRGIRIYFAEKDHVFTDRL